MTGGVAAERTGVAGCVVERRARLTGRRSAECDGPGRDGPGCDGPGCDGPGCDGPGRDGPGRDGPGPGVTGGVAAERTGVAGCVVERRARLTGRRSAECDGPGLTVQAATDQAATDQAAMGQTAMGQAAMGQAAVPHQL